MPWYSTSIYKLTLILLVTITSTNWGLFVNAQDAFNIPLPINERDPFSIDNSQIDQFNVFDNFERPRVPGDDFGAEFNSRITGQNLGRINWNARDRRSEEGWWHLYPFGERYFDTDIGNRPWHDRQVDLDFFFPYYGFRFNYTFIFPEGFTAFSYPWFIQPPYTFPTTEWPKKPDPSLIAAFMAPSSFMFVGDTGISHVWYRVVSRPKRLIGQRESGIQATQQNYADTVRRVVHRLPNGKPAFRAYSSDIVLKIQEGRIEDPELLDRITRDIQTGMVGARGFTADYALIITWERMGYGGAPKSTQLHMYERFKRWQNTFQMVIATDEIRSYTMFNYGNVNWTSSTAAGALFGRGGKQSAVVGFNGGNGTGFFEMPWSAEGNSYKLVQDGSTQTAGRWLARVDEVIEYGGCINTSTGYLQVDKPYGTMLGGFALNVSGPCFRENNVIKLQIYETNVDCERIDMVFARCIIPVNSLYRTGMVDIKLSIDGGKEYNFWNKYYLISPNMARRQVNLINDPVHTMNNWKNFDPENLTLGWQADNLTYSQNDQVDITLWGYWEDVEEHEFKEVGVIARNVPNRGAYSFNPRQLTRDQLDNNKYWKDFHFGVVQVRVANNWMQTRGDGIQWSKIIPFGWYFKDIWEYEIGSNWAIEKCIDWYEYDGRRYNFWMDLEPRDSCPCTLSQSVMDMGRFMPLYDCDMTGDSACPYTRGAFHCVLSVVPIWSGAAQTCCYDVNGWLMFSQDWEYNDNYLRFYSAGVPQRAHPFGAYPYKRPPYVPGLSNYYNDKMPYDICCKWAGHCEFYWWRRETSGCQEYSPPAAGFAYGEPHFITYDGNKYTFNGKGYFVLTMMKSPKHSLMVQVRMEQPPKTIWDSQVRATVITGIAAQDNSSDTVQVFSRKEFRGWRYRTDVYVDGIRIFFDKPWKKYQQFKGVSLRSPARNMNQSEIQIMFATGVGVRVMEARGMLDAMVVLPPEYNETVARRRDYTGFYREEYEEPPLPTGDKCAQYHRTMGLLGTFNGDIRDDLTTPDCNIVGIPTYPPSAGDARTIYTNFGSRWRVDGAQHTLLFQEQHKPLYDPLEFGKNPERFVPIFDPWRMSLGNASLIFTKSQVVSVCQGIHSCEYDYLMTGRREIALDTLSIEKKNEGLKRHAEKRLISCGPLQKNKGVIKFPPGNSYLDGVTVTFTCKPDYFLHGEQQRYCINGTWSPGWWAWCRKRTIENGLKWLTGILVSLLFILLIASILCWCYCINVRGRKHRAKHYKYAVPPPPNQQVKKTSPPQGMKFTPTTMPATAQEKIFSVPVMTGEPIRNHNGLQHRASSHFHETSA